MRHTFPSSAALAISAVFAAFLAGCAHDEPPPPPPTTTTSIAPAPAAPAAVYAPAATSGYQVVAASNTPQMPEAAIPAGQLTEPPVPVSQSRPVYPEDLRQTSTEGYAVVGFVVEPDGTVGYAQSLSATNQEFGDSAVTAIRGWRFQPGSLNGQVVKTYMQIPVYFTLAQPQVAAVTANPAAPLLPPTSSTAPVEVAIPPLPTGVYDVSQMDQYPVPISQQSPVYPSEERRAGTAGYATVLFVVEADGSVSNILAVRATDTNFGNAASEAVANWKFRPGTVHGVPVRCRVLVPIQFEIND